MLKRNISTITVICTSRHSTLKKLNEIKKKMEESKKHYCIFSTDQKRRNILLDELQTKLKQLSDGSSRNVLW